MRRRLPVLLLALSLLIVPMGGAAERIDDETVLLQGRFVHQPLEGSSEVVLVRKPAGGTRSMNDGYVGCSASDDLYPFDLPSHTPGSSIPLGTPSYPYDAVMKPDGTEVWFADASMDAVHVLDRATNTITHTIPTGDYTTGLAFSGDGSQAIAASRNDAWLAIINTSTYSVSDYVPMPADPGFVAYCPGNDLFYVSEWYGPMLWEVASDGSGILGGISLGGSLWQLVCSHDGQTLYVCNRSTDDVRVVDVASLTQTDTIPVGDDPWGIDITSDDELLVVGCEDSHEVYLVDLITMGTSVTSLTTQDDPRDVDLSDDDKYAYMPCGSDLDEVVVVDTGSGAVADRIAPVGASTTNCVSVSPQMGAPSVPDVPAIGWPGLVLVAAGLGFVLRRSRRR